MQQLIWGDFEFLTNNDYLEIRERILLSVSYMPYMIFTYSGFYELIMIPWMSLSLIVFVIELIVGAIKSAAIEAENPDNEMTWPNFLKRHQTHYLY